MPSMRAMMTAGPALSKCHVAGYNCSYVPIDHPFAFDEVREGKGQRRALWTRCDAWAASWPAVAVHMRGLLHARTRARARGALHVRACAS